MQHNQISPNIDLDRDFKHLRDLGEGEFGETHLYEYTGSSNAAIPKYCVIKKLRHDPTLTPEAIEKRKHAFMEEGRLVSELSQQYADQHPGKSCPFNNGFMAMHQQGDSQESIILLNFESLYPDGDMPAARGNLNELLDNIHSKRNRTIECPRFQKILSAHDKDPTIMMIHEFNDLYQSASTIHDLGVCHGDLALRNTMPREPTVDEHGTVVQAHAAVIDFGMARKVNSEGYAEHPITTKKPLQWYTVEAFKGNTSIQNDLFSLKICFLELLAKNLGLEMKQIVYIERPDEGVLNFAKSKLNLPSEKKDQQSLSIFLENAESAASQHSNKYAQIMLDSYSGFLQSVPAQGQDLLTIRTQDAALLTEGNEKFFRAMMREALSAYDANKNTVHDALLSVQRLMCLDIDPTIKETYRDTIQQLEAQQKQAVSDQRNTLRGRYRSMEAQQQQIPQPKTASSPYVEVEEQPPKQNSTPTKPI